MPLIDIIKLLVSIGLGPFDIILVIALYFVYRKNEDLWNRLIDMQKALDVCVEKLAPEAKAAETAQKQGQKVEWRPKP